MLQPQRPLSRWQQMLRYTPKAPDFSNPLFSVQFNGYVSKAKIS